METFALKVLGVDVRLTVIDSGLTSGDVLGDARYRFRGEVARLLAPMRLTTYNRDLSRSFETTLDGSRVDEGLDAFDPEVDDVLDLGTDAGIAAVALLLDRGEPFEVEVDLDTSTDGPFWAFHDLGHAADDVSADWESGSADFPGPTVWAEDRANVEGARRALGAGVSVDVVLGALSRLGAPFLERFGEASTALDDLLDGEGLPDDVRARVDEVAGRVESTAVDFLDWADADLDLDDLLESALEYGEEVRHASPGVVVVALRGFDNLADAYGSGESGPDVEARAAYAFGGAVVEAVRRLAQCEDCEQERRRPGATTCATCAEAY